MRRDVFLYISLQNHITNLETTVYVLRKELSQISGKMKLIDEYIGFTDLVNTGEDFNRARDFFQQLREDKLSMCQ
jgi:hypothetical protein